MFAVGSVELLLLGRRLPFPPLNEAFGNGPLSVRFCPEGEDSRKGSPTSAARESSAASLMKTYLKQVAQVRGRHPQLSVSNQETSDPTLDKMSQGLSQSALDDLTPPFALLEGLGSVNELSDAERRTMLVRAVEASLVPFLRKVHLLLKALDPSQ